MKSKDFIEWIGFYLTMAALKPSYHLVDVPRIVYHVSVMTIACVSGWFMFYQKYDDFSVNTDVLLHTVMVCHTLFVYLVYLQKRDVLGRIAQTMQDRFKELSVKLGLEKYHTVWDKADRLSLVIMKLGSFSCIVVYSFFIFNANSFSSRRKLLYPLWVPLSLESDVNYFLTIALQLSVFSLYSFIHVSGCGVCIGGSHFIGASFEVLGCAFRDLCESEMEMKDWANGKQKRSMLIIHQASVEEKLKWCVETHVEILRLTKDYRSVFEAILPEVLVSCEIIICFAGFQVVLATEMRDYQRAVMLVSVVLLVTFHLFLFCYPGQHIYNKSEQFRESLYLSRWEDQSLVFQKSLSLMLLDTLRPITISFRGIIHASMPSFLNALRTAFSYVNILLILREVK